MPIIQSHVIPGVKLRHMTTVAARVWWWLTPGLPIRYHAPMAYTTPWRDWPSPKRPYYRVQLELDVRAGTMECIGIHVQAGNPHRVVSGTQMREIPVGRLVADALRELHKMFWGANIDPGDPNPLPGVELDADFKRHRLEFFANLKTEAEVVTAAIQKAQPKLSLGHRWPAGHLKRVAALYKEARLVRRDPTAAVAETFGVSRSAASNWVARSRVAGFLPKARPGKADPPAPTKTRRKS